MMSRAAVYDAILADPRIQALGLDNSNVLVNYDAPQRPNDEVFLVLTWGDEAVALRGDDTEVLRTVRILTIWVHQFREFSTDFVRVDNIINILNSIMAGLVQTEGADGYTLTMAEFNTASRDLRDDTYQTICRSVSYRILSRETAPV